MKNKLNNTLLLASLIATTAVNAYTPNLSVTPYAVDAGKVTFVYPHPKYGNLDGIITAGGGRALGISTELARYGRLGVALEADYIDIDLQSVTVGGQPKNWGDSIQGYAVLAKASYTLEKPFGIEIKPTLGLGYQDILGGTPIASIGVEALVKEKSKLGLSLSFVAERRYIGASKYGGLTMDGEPSNYVGLKIGKNF